TIDVYEGMIVGENAKDNDLDVNVVREKNDQHALLHFRHGHPPGPLPQSESGTGHRIHHRRRVCRSHSEVSAPAQKGPPSQPSRQKEFHGRGRRVTGAPPSPSVLWRDRVGVSDPTTLIKTPPCLSTKR